MLTSGNSHSSTRATARKLPVQDRSRRTVEAILDAAAHLFVERGYAATTTNHVAEAAGVSVGSLYQYFPSKDALLVALDLRHLDHAEACLHVELAALARDAPPPAEWARRLVGVLVAINESDLDRLLYRIAPPVPEVERRVEALVRLMANDAQRHLTRFGATPAVARVRARITVVAALTLVHEVIIQARRGPSRRRVEAEVVRLVAGAA